MLEFKDNKVVEVPNATRTPEAPEVTLQRLSNAVDQHLDSIAHSLRYSNIDSACKARFSTKPKFAAEGAALYSLWEDTWEYVEQVEADVIAGIRSIPTEQELISELPVLDYTP